MAQNEPQRKETPPIEPNFRGAVPPTWLRQWSIAVISHTMKLRSQRAGMQCAVTATVAFMSMSMTIKLV